MTQEQWQRVRSILESALELDPADRAGFLIRACADPALRREIESLIAAHEQAGTGVLNSAALPGFLVEEARFSLLPGKRVGPYEIVEEIGVGGMGAVYRAARADGQYKQQVALKIVRADFGAENTASRFRNERQILASLDHPNIAKILDGGTTVDGLPYFVMEFVDGLPITDYCDRHKLPIDARLEIFRTVCSAVHYAHQHLVIHRDLKPSNILVTAEGIPKLLDFGIAKVLDPNLLPESSTMTAAGLWMMTPEYASPEQFRGEAITTATDVYSLGLVLYELLTGHRAHQFPNRAPHEIARVVFDTEPEKPSAAIRRTEAASEDNKLTPERVSGLRSDSPEKLQHRLAGDLDNIVLKALRKEPQERYTSADQLSEDIHRHVKGLPVLARKSTAAYRWRKYVLRHRVGVTAAALVFLSLLTGMALTVREARIARANQLRAERHFNDVRALANSLIFEVHDSIAALPGATAPRKLIVQRAQEYLDKLAAESQADPSLLRELAGAYTRLANVLGDQRDANVGNSEQALRDYRRAVELREAVVAALPSDMDSRRELAESYVALATLLQNLGDHGSQEFLNKALSMLKALAASNPGNLKIQSDLARTFQLNGHGSEASGKFPEAVPSFEKSLALYQHLSEADPKESKYLAGLASAHKTLGAALIEVNQLPSALEHYRAARVLDEAQMKADPGNMNRRYAITFTYSDIGYILGEQGEIDGALSYYRKAFDIRSELAAADPQDARARAGLANTYNYIARLLWRKGDLTSALDHEKQALRLRQTLSDSDPTNETKRLEVAFAQGSVGETYVKMAFQPHTTRQRQRILCEAAESWLQKSLPGLERGKNLLRPDDAEYPAKVQQAIDRCNQVLLH
jgi:eukaryotic-like serine/threonine-protein kinase